MVRIRVPQLDDEIKIVENGAAVVWAEVKDHILEVEDEAVRHVLSHVPGAEVEDENGQTASDRAAAEEAKATSSLGNAPALTTETVSQPDTKERK